MGIEHKLACIWFGSFKFELKAKHKTNTQNSKLWGSNIFNLTDMTCVREDSEAFSKGHHCSDHSLTGHRILFKPISIPFPLNSSTSAGFNVLKCVLMGMGPFALLSAIGCHRPLKKSFILQEYPRAITQKANTHSIESFVKLFKAYTIGSFS